ncbi:hypothetical protein [Microbulbifer pacificus]|uniref:hypothetical protein n=1 Tax=Microbulbifer pacificus TaxID=407164 RepID=UPI000CF3CA61|nr:hypothetical protein [Microbulbifer pacificus]
MTFKQEIYRDINENCDVVLNLLKGQPVTNDTAEGRMIYQCRWLKQQVAADALTFPVNDYVHTLKHVSAERLLEHLASSPDLYLEEIGIYLYRLLKLTKGKLLLKSEYYRYALRCIEELVSVLVHTTRPLSLFEQRAIAELTHLKQELASGMIEPPLMHYYPDYPNFREVNMSKISIDDLPNGEFLTKIVANLLFEGIRPDTWVTPDAADKETTNLWR